MHFAPVHPSAHAHRLRNSILYKRSEERYGLDPLIRFLRVSDATYQAQAAQHRVVLLRISDA